jgi:hypothetical protein
MVRVESEMTIGLPRVLEFGYPLLPRNWITGLCIASIINDLSKVASFRAPLVRVWLRVVRPALDEIAIEITGNAEFASTPVAQMGSTKTEIGHHHGTIGKTRPNGAWTGRRKVTRNGGLCSSSDSTPHLF